MAAVLRGYDDIQDAAGNSILGGGGGSGSGPVLLREVAAASQAEVEFIHGQNGVVLDDTYFEYVLKMRRIKPGHDNMQVDLEVGDSGGYKTADYATLEVQVNHFNGPQRNTSESTDAVKLTGVSAGFGIDSGDSANNHNWNVTIPPLSLTGVYKNLSYERWGSYGGDSNMRGYGGGVWDGGSGALDRFKVKARQDGSATASSFEGGVFQLWGIPAS